MPDRKDFYRYAGDDAARLRAWQTAIDAGKIMRDAFASWVECVDPVRQIKPL